jgi:hypothetical protein
MDGQIAFFRFGDEGAADGREAGRGHAPVRATRVGRADIDEAA